MAWSRWGVQWGGLCGTGLLPCFSKGHDRTVKIQYFFKGIVSFGQPQTSWISATPARSELPV